MAKKIIGLLFILLLITPAVSAHYLNNTVINNTGLNTWFNITYPWNFTELIAENGSYIYVRNMTSSNPAEVSNEGLTWNLTESNAEYNGTDVPYYSASSSIQKTIRNPFSVAVGSGQTIIDVAYCNMSNVSYSSALSVYDQNFSSSDFSCSANELTLNLSGLDPGNNIIDLGYNVSFTNCTGGNVSIIFSIYDENNPPQLLVADAEVDIEHWVNPVFVRNFSHEFTGNHTYRICLDPSHANISADVYIKYDTTNGFTHRYYVHNGTFTNTTTNLTMFNTNTTTGYTDLKLTTRYADTYAYFVDVVTSLERFYPGENTWRVIQMGKSGDFGISVYNVIEKDVDYRLVFRDTENHVLKRTQTMKFKQDPTTGIIDLTFLLDEYSPATTPSGFSADYDFDNSTKLLTVNWTDSTGSTSAVRVYVTKETMAGTTDLCDDTYYSSSGSGTCNLTGQTGELMLVVEADGSDEINEWVNVDSQTLGDLIGVGEGALWTAAILITVVAFGMFSPAGGIISLTIGLIIVAFLGIFPAITMPVIIIISVLAIIIGVKVRS